MYARRLIAVFVGFGMVACYLASYSMATPNIRNLAMVIGGMLGLVLAHRFIPHIRERDAANRLSEMAKFVRICRL
jgi:hypothetical protein